jgi:hypothetical protein
MKRYLAPLFGLLLCLTPISFAQNAQLSGFVSDPSGKGIAGARVTMTDIATQAEQTSITNNAGVYAFAILPASRYRLVVKSSGLLDKFSNRSPSPLATSSLTRRQLRSVLLSSPVNS